MTAIGDKAFYKCNRNLIYKNVKVLNINKKSEGIMTYEVTIHGLTEQPSCINH